MQELINLNFLLSKFMITIRFSCKELLIALSFAYVIIKSIDLNVSSSKIDFESGKCRVKFYITINTFLKVLDLAKRPCKFFILTTFQIISPHIILKSDDLYAKLSKFINSKIQFGG